MARIFLFSELGDRSPARAALTSGDDQVISRILQGSYIDCPIALPPDLVILEPAPLRPVEPLAPALAQHPVVARVPWLIVLDPERLHLAARLPCNDFIVRGFAPPELLARVERVLGAKVQRDTVLRSGPLAVDLAAHTVRIGDAHVRLTPQEFALLRFFVQHPGRPLSREQLLSAVWGRDYLGGPRTVDIHVRRLRARLGDAASPLQTLRQHGYRWA